MHMIVLPAALVLAAAAAAAEYPVVLSVFPVTSSLARQSDPSQPRPETTWSPVWAALERMTLSERQNSEISLELPSDAGPEAHATACDVENLWNTGRYDQALAGFAEVGQHVDIRQVAVGNRWRTPVATAATDWWGNDARIGDRDSIRRLAFDIDRASGNLFAILQYQEGSEYGWSVNHSTDGGSSWSETYTWLVTYQLGSLNASVLSGDCYVSYGASSPNRELRLRRFYTSTGTEHEFQGDQISVTVATFSGADSIREIAMTSTQDFTNDRLYVLAMTFAGKLGYFYDDTAAVSWDSTPATGITDAAWGVDACTNEGYDSTFIWVSYLDTEESLHIAGRRQGVWRNFITYRASSTSTTSIGAWHDTVLCVFGYPDPTEHVGYLVNYEGGNPGVRWWFDDVGGDSMTMSETPDVAMRNGGGTGIIYGYHAPGREYRFTWRRYAGAWSTPVTLSSHEYAWLFRPGIEYLGNGVYGIVYLSLASPIRGAFFNRSDWTGVAEQRRLVMEENILSVTPNPLSGRGRLNYALNRPAALRVQVFDRAGRVVRTLFDSRSAAGRHSLGFDAAGMAPGVYFVRAAADGTTLTVPVTVVK